MGTRYRPTPTPPSMEGLYGDCPDITDFLGYPDTATAPSGAVALLITGLFLEAVPDLAIGVVVIVEVVDGCIHDFAFELFLGCLRPP